MGLVALAVCVLLVPVKNAADKRGDESDLGFSTSYSLGEGEEQRHVAVDPILLLQLPVQRTHTQSSGYQRKKKTRHPHTTQREQNNLFSWARNKISQTEKIDVYKQIDSVYAFEGYIQKQGRTSWWIHMLQRKWNMTTEIVNPHRPAWIPSQVEESLISTRSLLTSASSYRAMSRLALATISSLSKDNLAQRGTGWRHSKQQISLQYNWILIN